MGEDSRCRRQQSSRRSPVRWEGKSSISSPRCSRSIARLGTLRLKMVLVPPGEYCATSTCECRAPLAKKSTKNPILGILVKQSTSLCRKRSCGPPSHSVEHCMYYWVLYGCPSTENVAKSSFEHISLSRGTRVPRRHCL
jgi:hypothetical protein